LTKYRKFKKKESKRKGGEGALHCLRVADLRRGKVFFSEKRGQFCLAAKWKRNQEGRTTALPKKKGKKKKKPPGGGKTGRRTLRKSLAQRQKRKEKGNPQCLKLRGKKLLGSKRKKGQVEKKKKPLSISKEGEGGGGSPETTAIGVHGGEKKGGP